MFDTFTISDWLQFWGILASLLTSIVAISISVVTLKQNSKMIEESTRPILSVYSKYSDDVLYYIIKNFGTSTAHIDRVTTDFYIPKEQNNMVEGNPFSSLNNSVLAPNSSKICPVVSYSLENKVFNFDIEYHSASKCYNEHFVVDGNADNPFPDTYPNADKPEKALKQISKSLHNLYKTKL